VYSRPGWISWTRTTWNSAAEARRIEIRSFLDEEMSAYSDANLIAKRTRRRDPLFSV